MGLFGCLGPLSFLGPTVPEQFCRPPVTSTKVERVDLRKLRNLIQDGKLAPFFPGAEEPNQPPPGHDIHCAILYKLLKRKNYDMSGLRETMLKESGEACPICFYYYPVLNTSRCCAKRICTECYIQVQTVRASQPACPFCKLPNYSAKFVGPKTHEEREQERLEQQKVDEAQARERQEEMQRDKEREAQRTTQQAARSASGPLPINDDHTGYATAHITGVSPSVTSHRAASARPGDLDDLTSASQMSLRTTRVTSEPPRRSSSQMIPRHTTSGAYSSGTHRASSRSRRRDDSALQQSQSRQSRRGSARVTHGDSIPVARQQPMTDPFGNSQNNSQTHARNHWAYQDYVPNNLNDMEMNNVDDINDLMLEQAMYDSMTAQGFRTRSQFHRSRTTGMPVSPRTAIAAVTQLAAQLTNHGDSADNSPAATPTAATAARVRSAFHTSPEGPPPTRLNHTMPSLPTRPTVNTYRKPYKGHHNHTNPNIERQRSGRMRDTYTSPGIASGQPPQHSRHAPASSTCMDGNSTAVSRGTQDEVIEVPLTDDDTLTEEQQLALAIKLSLATSHGKTSIQGTHGSRHTSLPASGTSTPTRRAAPAAPVVPPTAANTSEAHDRATSNVVRAATTGRTTSEGSPGSSSSPLPNTQAQTMPSLSSYRQGIGSNPGADRHSNGIPAALQEGRNSDSALRTMRNRLLGCSPARRSKGDHLSSSRASGVSAPPDLELLCNPLYQLPQISIPAGANESISTSQATTPMSPFLPNIPAASGLPWTGLSNSSLQVMNSASVEGQDTHACGTQVVTDLTDSSGVSCNSPPPQQHLSTGFHTPTEQPLSRETSSLAAAGTRQLETCVNSDAERVGSMNSFVTVSSGPRTPHASTGMANGSHTLGLAPNQYPGISVPRVEGCDTAPRQINSLPSPRSGIAVRGPLTASQPSISQLQLASVVPQQLRPAENSPRSVPLPQPPQQPTSQQRIHAAPHTQPPLQTESVSPQARQPLTFSSYLPVMGNGRLSDATDSNAPLGLQLSIAEDLEEAPEQAAEQIDSASTVVYAPAADDEVEAPQTLENRRIPAMVNAIEHGRSMSRPQPQGAFRAYVLDAFVQDSNSSNTVDMISQPTRATAGAARTAQPVLVQNPDGSMYAGGLTRQASGTVNGVAGPLTRARSSVMPNRSARSVSSRLQQPDPVDQALQAMQASPYADYAQEGYRGDYELAASVDFASSRPPAARSSSYSTRHMTRSDAMTRGDAELMQRIAQNDAAVRRSFAASRFRR